MNNGNFLLLPYFAAYFLLGFALRSFIVYRRTGINPLVLPFSQDAYGYVGRAFKILIVFCAFTVFSLALLPNVTSWLGSIPFLQIAFLKWAGWVLLLASLLWMLIAQAQMGTSWRVGIDTANHTALVRSGLFSVSRNPIFLAVRVSLLGLFFVAPNAATFAILIAGEVLVQVQVRLEESHLNLLHANVYSSYCLKVPRWV